MTLNLKAAYLVFLVGTAFLKLLDIMNVTSTSRDIFPTLWILFGRVQVRVTN